MAGLFDEQIEAQEGVDFFIGETFWHFGEALLCLERIKTKTGVPAMITVAFRGSDKADDGVAAAECGRRLRDAGADIVGVNCMRDPERTIPLIEEMRNATDGFLLTQNAWSGETRRLEGFDAFVYAYGGVAWDPISHQLNGQSDCRVVGDAFAPRTLQHAIMEGHLCGRKI